MAVLRIVANLAAERPEDARRFYGDLLGLEPVMDHGWIVTFAGDRSAQPQISVASSGGSGTAVPDLSIEVDDLDTIEMRVKAVGLTPFNHGDYEPGRRFYFFDPDGIEYEVVSYAERTTVPNDAAHERLSHLHLVLK